MDEKELIEIDNSIFLGTLQVQDHIQTDPRAMERKEKVQFTFLVNRRAGASGNF